MARPVIKVAIDPGYSSIKVICEGLMFSLPCDVIENTGNEDKFISEKKENYAAVSMFGKTYLVGDYARKLLLESNRQKSQDLQHDVLADYERFGSNYIEVSIKAAIAIALVQYCEFTQVKHLKPTIHVENLNKCDIYLAIALPHAVVEMGSKGSKGFLKDRCFGKMEYSLELSDKTYNMNFTIRPDVPYKFQSQVIAAFLGAVEDEKGQPLNVIDTSENEKPILVIDGGYKTVGIFRLSKTDSVEEAESNPDFAMAKVDIDVAKRLAERGREDIKDYNIQELYDSREEIAVEDNDGRTYMTTVIKDRDEIIKQYCSVMIDYLCSKYGNLKSIKQILVTGGTGAAYFDTFVDYISRTPKMNHLIGRVKLAEYKFMGQPVAPMYAIVTGLYKQFARFINQNYIENNEEE